MVFLINVSFSFVGTADLLNIEEHFDTYLAKIISIK